MLAKSISRFWVSSILSLIFLTVSYSQSDLATKVADAYGFKNFSKVKSISFTFNVKTKDRTFKRSWYWEPGTNKVTYDGPGRNNKPMTYSYTTGSIDKKDSMKSFVDSRFINDQYWLLFSFHLIWDKKAEITDAGIKPYPISKKQAHCLIVKYPPSAGGYTPGDIFELYVGKDNLIHEWVYRAGGKKDGRALTWEGYKNFDGLNISTLHNVADKSFKLWFSNIKITLK
jgi:hypothetical protein